MKSICLIDDSNTLRFTIKKLLEICGFKGEIMEFINGEEAYEYFASNQHEPEKIPEVILLDINMPLMNGWEFMSAFEKLEDLEKTPIIHIVSSSISDLDKNKVNEFTKVTNYYVKPLDVKTIKQILSDTKSLL